MSQCKGCFDFFSIREVQENSSLEKLHCSDCSFSPSGEFCIKIIRNYNPKHDTMLTSKQRAIRFVSKKHRKKISEKDLIRIIKYLYLQFDYYFEE